MDRWDQLSAELGAIHGALAAYDAVIAAVLEVLSPQALEQLGPRLRHELDNAYAMRLNSRASDALLDSLQTQGDRHMQRLSELLDHLANIRRVAPGILLPPEG